MTRVVDGHSWVYCSVAAAFLCHSGMTSNNGSRSGVAGVFATASSPLHLAKVQTDTGL